jgi:hypothetical protein
MADSEWKKRSREKENLRRNKRSHVAMSAELHSNDSVASCSVLNLSTGGTKIQIAQVLEQNAEVGINIGKVGQITGRVAWSRTPYHGLQFEENTEHIAEKLMAIALYSDNA